MTEPCTTSSEWKGYHYFIIRSSGPIGDEFTNVGVMLFDIDTGRQLAARTDSMERAIARDDYHRGIPTLARDSNPVASLQTVLDEFPSHFPTEQELEKAQTRMGWIYSSFDTSPPRGGIYPADDHPEQRINEVMEGLWKSFITGPSKDTQ